MSNANHSPDLPGAESARKRANAAIAARISVRAFAIAVAYSATPWPRESSDLPPTARQYLRLKKSLAERPVAFFELTHKC